MKIIFHEKFYNSEYALDPAAAPGRLESIMNIIEKDNNYEVITPKAASDSDILRVHTAIHFHKIRKKPLLFEIASLSAGGAILAAEEAFSGNPSFAVIRPSGHHSCSYVCTCKCCCLNNMAISLLKLFYEKKIKTAFVLDFDYHFGEGTVKIFSNRVDDFQALILNPKSKYRKEYIKEVESFMQTLKNIDIFAASAGFDEYEKDLGKKLKTEDFNKLGHLMKKYSEELCNGKRFAILEGGYYIEDLGKNVDAFCKGFM
jgi:acetoin utilization deacetylase AcuC-like enzyme